MKVKVSFLWIIAFVAIICSLTACFGSNGGRNSLNNTTWEGTFTNWMGTQTTVTYYFGDGDYNCTTAAFVVGFNIWNRNTTSGTYKVSGTTVTITPDTKKENESLLGLFDTIQGNSIDNTDTDSTSAEVITGTITGNSIKIGNTIYTKQQ